MKNLCAAVAVAVDIAIEAQEAAEGKAAKGNGPKRKASEEKSSA